MKIKLLLINILFSSPVMSVMNTASAHEPNTNASLSNDRSEPTGQPRLHRRMEPFMPQELEDAFGRGWDYLHLMFADAVSASRIIEEWGREGKEIRGPEGHKQRDWLTRFKTRSLNAVAGWTQTDCSHDRDLLEPLVPALANVLPDGEAAQEDSERPDRPNVGLMTRNAGPNRCFLWEQDQHYLPLGSHDLYAPTQAKFRACYNVRDGFVIIHRATTPESGREIRYDTGEHDREAPDARQISAELPSIKDWEDLLFISWESTKETSRFNTGYLPEVMVPRWIVWQEGWGGDMLIRIVRTCLQSRGFTDNKIPPFPGQIFFAGSWCFNSLLQTEQNVRLVWLLALHKGHWGVKVMSSVRVFLSNKENAALPSLIWEVQDDSMELSRSADLEFNKGLGGP